jgi:hypothetical protein
MVGVGNVAEFVDPALLPKGKVCVLGRESSDPADGLTLGYGLRAYSLWGDLAFRQAGAEGCRRVENADKTHVSRRDRRSVRPIMRSPASARHTT